MSPQKKTTLFLFLTFGLSMFSYIPIIRAGTLNVNGGMYVLTIMWSPGLAAILTQLISARTLRGLGWRVGPARWLGIAYILPIVYALPVYVFTWLAGLGVFPNPTRIASLAERYSSSNVVTTVSIFLLISLTVDMVGPLILALGEEIGWRGLLVPELAKMTSFTRTSLISGIVWAAWHMPAIFLADYNTGGRPDWYAAIMFAVMIIATSFAYAWLRLKSGSLWPAVLLHASHNQLIQGIFDKLTGNTSATPYLLGEFGVGLALTSIVVAYIFWHMQRDKSLMTQPVSSQPVVQPE
ncbi:MAG TPA: type II CAAX endopeptidase family protein [Anaerolineales bacterium]|nr:type II CAAX endopeptidase family protein [Anaerolineales bacterium]